MQWWKKGTDDPRTQQSEIPTRYPESSSAIVKSICNTLPGIKRTIEQVQQLYNY